MNLAQNYTRKTINVSYNNIFLGIFIGKWGHTHKNYGYFMAIYSKKIGVLIKTTNIYFKLCYY
ncbi:hypothetical protein AM498_04435 [Helicobacter pylori]|nr:hypothetical protein AM498_04435 [Helicobacter pylori]